MLQETAYVAPVDGYLNDEIVYYRLNSAQIARILLGIFEHNLWWLVYSNDESLGKGGRRRGTGEDWMREVVVEPYKRKQSSNRSS